MLSEQYLNVVISSWKHVMSSSSHTVKKSSKEIQTSTSRECILEMKEASNVTAERWQITFL